MRPLTDTETQTLFTKLANYTGRSLNNLLTDTAKTASKAGKEAEDRYVFRIQESRVYYVRESLANLATSVSRDSLLSLGTCLGKFTKTGKFRLHITALDVIAPHARYKIWVKANGEMPFLYGGHVVKAHVGRWSEECPEHSGVVVLSMNDTPLVCLHSSIFQPFSPIIHFSPKSGPRYTCLLLTLTQGFGVTARSTTEAKRLDPTGIVCFRQADIGEYLREEDSLFAT